MSWNSTRPLERSSSLTLPSIHPKSSRWSLALRSYTRYLVITPTRQLMYINNTGHDTYDTSQPPRPLILRGTAHSRSHERIGSLRSHVYTAFGGAYVHALRACVCMFTSLTNLKWLLVPISLPLGGFLYEK